jgi:hypothetical protein
MQIESPIKFKRSKSEESSVRGTDEITPSTKHMDLNLQRCNSSEVADTFRTMEPDETTIDVNMKRTYRSQKHEIIEVEDQLEDSNEDIDRKLGEIAIACSDAPLDLK